MKDKLSRLNKKSKCPAKTKGFGHDPFYNANRLVNKTDLELKPELYAGLVYLKLAVSPEPCDSNWAVAAPNTTAGSDSVNEAPFEMSSRRLLVDDSQKSGRRGGSKSASKKGKWPWRRSMRTANVHFSVDAPGEYLGDAEKEGEEEQAR